jgi:hypothetical protein
MVRKNYPKLAELINFITSSGPLQPNGAQGLRSLMSHMRNISGEFDPSKDVHRATFKLALAQFSIFVNEMIRDFHNIFNPGNDKYIFEQTLRYYIWGGKENYDLRQRLNTAVKASRGITETEPFEFPSWDKFVDYFRNCLDSPFSLSATCLPIKDMAFRELSAPLPNLDRNLQKRLKANNRVRQFSLAAAYYFSDACRLPREFKEFFSTELNMLIDDEHDPKKHSTLI